MNDYVYKFRFATGPTRDDYGLVTVYPDGHKEYQILTSDEDGQQYPVVVGPADVIRVNVEVGGVTGEFRILRIDTVGARHLRPEAADTTSPRLLAFFPDILYYVYGDEPEVYEVATGEAVGYVSG